jgi:hypothetical protein
MRGMRGRKRTVEKLHSRASDSSRASGQDDDFIFQGG